MIKHVYTTLCALVLVLAMPLGAMEQKKESAVQSSITFQGNNLYYMTAGTMVLTVFTVFVGLALVSNKYGEKVKGLSILAGVGGVGLGVAVGIGSGTALGKRFLATTTKNETIKNLIDSGSYKKI